MEKSYTRIALQSLLPFVPKFAVDTRPMGFA
jgi:hypothetical protein